MSLKKLVVVVGVIGFGVYLAKKGSCDGRTTYESQETESITE